MLREDNIEQLIMGELVRLVCPSQEIIEWVVQAMRTRHQEQIARRQQHTQSLQAQLRRLERMEETLYDDKLSGEITKERYEVKHEQISKQKLDIQQQIDRTDNDLSERLEQRLVILELSQKAASIYAQKSPEQKRLIISKLFARLTIKAGSLSVKYSKFAEAIAERVQKTRNLMEVRI